MRFSYVENCFEVRSAPGKRKEIDEAPEHSFTLCGLCASFVNFVFLKIAAGENLCRRLQSFSDKIFFNTEIQRYKVAQRVFS